MSRDLQIMHKKEVYYANKNANKSVTGRKRQQKERYYYTLYPNIYFTSFQKKKITRTVLAIKMKGFSSSQGAIMHKIDQKGPICTLCQ